MSGEGAQPAAAVVDAAIAWKVRLEAQPEDHALRAQWAEWLARDPQHALAWQRLEQVDARLAGVPGRLASETLARAPADADRRRVLKGLGALALLGAGGWGLQQSGLWHRLRADHATAVGERQRIALADGGTLWLNTDTAVTLSEGREPREIRLLRGELRLQTGPGAAVVSTSHGRFQPVGTRFVVRLGAAGTQLWVEQGSVQATTADPAGARQRVRAGSGVLVGSRRIAPVAGVLDTVAATLPVRIERRTAYWVTVRPA